MRIRTANKRRNRKQLVVYHGVIDDIEQIVYARLIDKDDNELQAELPTKLFRSHLAVGMLFVLKIYVHKGRSRRSLIIQPVYYNQEQIEQSRKDVEQLIENIRLL